MGGGGRGRGVGRTVTAMRERSVGDLRGKDGVTAGKEERRGGRLCEESRGKEKEKTGHQRPREANGLKSSGTDGKGKVCPKGDNRGGKLKLNNVLSTQEVYLTAMVVPRTPVAPRNQDKTQDQGDEPICRVRQWYCTVHSDSDSVCVKLIICNLKVLMIL